MLIKYIYFNRFDLYILFHFSLKLCLLNLENAV